MSKPVILYVSDDPSTYASLARSLAQAGYETLTTSSSGQAIALLFVSRKLEAVLLDQRKKEHASLGLAWILRSIRADVPILLLSPEVLEPLPRCLDACVCLGQEFESLLPVLNTLVGASWDGRLMSLQH